MPIRFRCAYCHQLMGIARRKAGTVVSCPTCSGQVVVPQPDPQAAAPPRGPSRPRQNAGGVFEQPDFSDVFQQPTNGAGNHSPPAMQASAASASRMDVEPVYLPGDGGETAGLVLTAGKLVLLVIIVLLLVTLAFVGGLLIGRTTVG